MGGTVIVLILIFGVFLYKVWKPKKGGKGQTISTYDVDACKAWLEKNVLFYRRLSNEKKDFFYQRLMAFLEDTKITGIKTTTDYKVDLAVACSAIIPVYHFDGFTYPNVDEVLIYPNPFGRKFELAAEDRKGFNASGMVGTGFMNGKMILSKPDLMKAYDGLNHKYNVGIHEFVHLIDKCDGIIDGIVDQLVTPRQEENWNRWMEKEKRRIVSKKSDINPYALTSPAEFFAVCCEYYFMDPETFKVKHEELYDALSSMFSN